MKRGPAPSAPEEASEFLLYQADDGQTRIQVRVAEETVWLSQAQMSELFQTTKQNVSLHIRNVVAESELMETAVVKDYLTTAGDGKRYSTRNYNLDVIILVMSAPAVMAGTGGVNGGTGAFS